MKAFSKDIFRTIKGSMGRFMAIFLIVGLGSGFYAALNMVCPDMKYCANNYFDNTNMMDVRIVSTMGLTQDDLSAIKDLDCVDKAALAYETDIYGGLGGKQFSIRVHSLTNDANVNTVELKEGRFPEKSGECVISNDCIIAADKSIGEKISVDECITDIDTTLSVKEFEIVGKVESPLYVSFASPGTSNLGSGQLDEYIYVTEDSFAQDYPYNEVFLTAANAKELDSYSSQYDSLIDSVTTKLKEIAPEREQARYDQLKGDAQSELDEKKKEFEDKRDETNQKLDDAQSQLDSSKAKLDSSKSKLDKTPGQLNEAQEKLDSAQAEIDSGKQQLSQMKSQLADVNSNIDSVNAGLAQIEQAESYGQQSEQMTQQKNELTAQLASLQSAKAQLEAGISQAESSIAAGEAQIAQGNSQLESARSHYSSGLSQYKSGQSQYSSGAQDLAENRTTAETELADAQKKLDEAQEKIDDIEKPEWMVMDRSKIVTAASYESDAERVDNIAKIFPLIFFLVAALVALTTMTRMIEEERLNIGTYKALGYSRAQISRKFLVYALLASAAGAILGIVLLSEILPTVIIVAYSILYRMPHGILMPINLPIAAISFAAGVGITVLVTLASTWASLHENPASLMRPKTGKAGKKILLERIKPIWKKMSFSWKVTTRNIARYKKRSIMTIIGIGGCTALLLTGFGLGDAVNDIIDKQFGQTILYNVTVTENDDLSDEKKQELATLIEDSKELETYTKAEIQPIVSTSDKADGKELNITMVVPEKPSEFDKVWQLRDRTSKQNFEISDDGVYICEKLKSLLNVDVGDDVILCTQDDMGNATNQRINAKVAGVFENYVNNYIVCSDKFYNELFKTQAPEYSSYYGKLKNETADRDGFAEKLKATDSVKTITYNDEVIDTYRTALSSVNMVVIVLVVCAALLAFVVLYNLNNINICERRREIATLQVLGFMRKEVEMYIYRETIVLTIVGCLVGLLFGIWLEGFVVNSAESDYFMFGKEIHALSFLISGVITVAFSLFVMFVMRRKFDKVDMVESLKSAE